MRAGGHEMIGGQHMALWYADRYPIWRCAGEQQIVWTGMGWLFGFARVVEGGKRGDDARHRATDGLNHKDRGLFWCGSRRRCSSLHLRDGQDRYAAVDSHVVVEVKVAFREPAGNVADGCVVLATVVLVVLLGRLCQLVTATAEKSVSRRDMPLYAEEKRDTKPRTGHTHQAGEENGDSSKAQAHGSVACSVTAFGADVPRCGDGRRC